MFRSQKDHHQGVRQTFLKLHLCTTNMYACVGDALGIKLCPCLPVDMCSLLLCLIPSVLILARYKNENNHYLIFFM
jgi:hypothetical protein